MIVKNWIHQWSDNSIAHANTASDRTWSTTNGMLTYKQHQLDSVFGLVNICRILAVQNLRTRRCVLNIFCLYVKQLLRPSLRAQAGEYGKLNNSLVYHVARSFVDASRLRHITGRSFVIAFNFCVCFALCIDLYWEIAHKGPLLCILFI